MKVTDLTTKNYYHGSSKKLPIGTVLKGRGGQYEQDWGETLFYSILEANRPSDMIAHKQAVFMVDNIDDIDNAGGATDWIFRVKPLGPVQRHDINWASEIDCLISDGQTADSDQVKQAATNYWNGVPHHDESVWEYLTTQAEIIRVSAGF